VRHYDVVEVALTTDFQDEVVRVGNEVAEALATAVPDHPLLAEWDHVVGSGS
jgi:hypothetical protein